MRKKYELVVSILPVIIGLAIVAMMLWGLYEAFFTTS